MHALAGIDHRPFGADQQRGGFLHMHRIGAVAGAQHRRIVQRFRYFLVPHVGRDFHDHRAAAAVFQPGEGAAEDITNFGCDGDRLGRLRERLHRLTGIEIRFDICQPPRIAHRQHQHRHGFAVTLRNAAHGVFRARAVLHAERADAAPRGDPGDRVRHVDANAFLPHHHRADVGGRGVFDDVIDGVAAEDLDPLTLHDFRNGGAEFHADPPVAGRCWARPRAVVGTGIDRSVKRVERVSREALPSCFASRCRLPSVPDPVQAGGCCCEIHCSKSGERRDYCAARRMLRAIANRLRK